MFTQKVMFCRNARSAEINRNRERHCIYPMRRKFSLLLILFVILSGLTFVTTSCLSEDSAKSGGEHGERKGIMPQFTVASGVAIASSDTETPGKSAIGFDGTNYLVVSFRNAGSFTGIYGVIVKGSGTGEVLTSFPIIQLLTQANLRIRPDVAFDGTNYLVVFNRSGLIYGTRVSPSGTVFDGPNGFVISATGTSNFDPVIAFDGTNYLVAWGKFYGDYDIYGARITTNGKSLNTVGIPLDTPTEFPIFQATGEQVLPAIAFDGNNYMVVWTDTRSGSIPGDDTDIYGTRVTKGGVVLDPTGIPISTASSVQSSPGIAYDGTNYFVVWVDDRHLNSDIYGTRLKTDGILLDGPSTTGGIAINNASDGTAYPRVSFDGTEYFVVWSVPSYSHIPNAGIHGARVSTDGNLIDGSSTGTGISISGAPPDYARFVYPNILSNGANSLLIWVNSGTAQDIDGVLIYPF